MNHALCVRVRVEQKRRARTSALQFGRALCFVERAARGEPRGADSDGNQMGKSGSDGVRPWKWKGQ